MLRWVIAGELARDCQPGSPKEHHLLATREEVEAWIEAVKRFQIQSLLCLQSREPLMLKASRPINLLAYYRQHGFQVIHLPARACPQPPFSPERLQHLWTAYLSLPKPVLVNDSASRRPTRQAIDYILQCRAELGE